MCNHFLRTSEKNTRLLWRHSTRNRYEASSLEWYLQTIFWKWYVPWPPAKIWSCWRQNWSELVLPLWTDTWKSYMRFQEFTGCIAQLHSVAWVSFSIAQLHSVAWVSFNAVNKPAVSIFRQTEVQVNCFSPSSGCQCSIQLKQIITHKIKPNVPSKHQDKHSTWCKR